MVVGDLDFIGVTVAPLETHTPLLIDADTELADTISFQRFETVAPERPQLVKARGCVENFKAAGIKVE